MRTSTFAEVVSEPGTVRAGQLGKSKIISELQAQINLLVEQSVSGVKVSEPKLFFVIKTG